MADRLTSSARLSLGACVLSAIAVLLLLYTLWTRGRLPRLMLYSYPPLVVWAVVTAGYAFSRVYRCAMEVRDELLQKAFEDETTGLLNLRYLQERLREEQQRIRRRGGCCAVLYLDLDHFKRVNDLFGHPTGNLVLREIAQTMKALVRASDALGRAGGDEFIVVMPETTAEEARDVAERLCRGVAEFSCEVGPDKSVDFLRVSVGVATYPADGGTTKAVVGAADRAVYEAKRLGGGRVCRFADSVMVQSSAT
jgi:diguanylate cyclase (GGDEF)-like protein